MEETRIEWQVYKNCLIILLYGVEEEEEESCAKVFFYNEGALADTVIRHQPTVNYAKDDLQIQLPLLSLAAQGLRQHILLTCCMSYQKLEETQLGRTRSSITCI